MTNALIADRDRFTAQHPEQRIDLNGRNWGYLDIGAGPVLFLIPGTLGRGDVFWQQINALKGRLRIIAPSYPETGGVADWCEDIIALMDHLKIDTASILGSSLGGFLAQFIAGKYPQRMDRLIAANTLHSTAGIDQRPPYSSDLEQGPIEELRAGFGKGLEGWRAEHPEQSDLVDLLLMEVGGRILEPELRRRLAAIKHGPELPAVGLPSEKVFTIDAADDPLIPPEMRDAVRARLQPCAAYRYLSGGHFPYIARPDTYTALLEQVMGLAVAGPDWGTDAERFL
jgi:pimeloyl-ACP methyl ester carboxylesterase